MNIVINKALLNRKQAISIKTGNSSNRNAVLAIMAEIAQFGYTFDKDVIDSMTKLSLEELKSYKEFLISELKVMVGSHVKYVPLFKSFPKDIPNTEELYLKKILGIFQNLFGITSDEGTVLECGHFVDERFFNLSNYSGCPICEKQIPSMMDHDESNKSFEKTKANDLKVIKLADELVVFDIFNNLLSSKTSLSDNDKEFLQCLVSLKKDEIIQFIPEKIDQKETLSIIIDLLMKNTTNYSDFILKNIKTTVDVLRLAAQFSGGDVSLAVPCKFKLTNKNRKLIMRLVDGINNSQIDMMRHREQWLRLGETIHIGSFKNKYKNAFLSFEKLRNDSKNIMTFNKKLEPLMNSIHKNKVNNNEVKELLNLLSDRSGEFVRRLDVLLRKSENPTLVVSAFVNTVNEIKTVLLLNIYKHFQDRSDKKTFRSFLPKGQLAKIKYFEGDNRAVIQKYIANEIVAISKKELLSRFSLKEKMGTVFIDPEIKNVLVPASQRSASKSLVNIPRGSRIKIADVNFVRLYTYWKHHSDVDLGAILLDKDFKVKSTINYYSLSSFGESCHSGDIRNGQHGATEFIDLDLKAFRAQKVKYVGVTIYSYSGEKFSEMECFAGFMERERPDQKQFDATTIKQKFDVTSNTTQAIPMIFDIENNEFIWIDLSGSEDSLYANHSNTESKLIQRIKAALDLSNTKLTLFELFELHSIARADKIHYEKVEGVDYDYIFDLEKLKDLDEIMSKYLD